MVAREEGRLCQLALASAGAVLARPSLECGRMCVHAGAEREIARPTTSDGDAAGSCTGSIIVSPLFPCSFRRRRRSASREKRSLYCGLEPTAAFG